MNDSPKHVVSATLTEAAGWQNSHVLGPYHADAIRAGWRYGRGRRPARWRNALATVSVCHPLQRRGWQTDECVTRLGQGYSLIAAH